MDTGSVAPSWKLAAPIAARAQGLVVTGFGKLPTGRALLLNLGAPDAPKLGGGWLKALDAVAPVTSATPPNSGGGDDQSAAVAIAIAWTGLDRMGLDETALASFSRPFREGMLQEDRLRRLGDRRRDAWRETVVEGGLVWSANTPARAPVTVGPRAYDVLKEVIETPVTTAQTVHAILYLFARDEASAAALDATVEAALAPHGVSVARRLDLFLDIEHSGISSEHFGFADGLSQPAPFDETGAVTLGGAPVLERDRVQGVPLGEFLIGYLNGHHEKAPGPVAPGPTEALDPAAAGLAPHPEARGFYDLGRDGSYMVVRELKQDVAAFWRSMDKAAEAIRVSDPTHSAHVTAEWLAERVVGRNRAGHLLCPGGSLPPAANGAPDSGFLFLDRDPDGAGCPAGSHVRRAFPRDALAPNAAEGPSLLAAANNHRILRRGRKYGPKIADPRTDDGADRGLLFVCLNTDIARQFEFIQQTWLLNSDFATLFEEVDPLIGPDGAMTLRDTPLRRRVHVETFVQAVGGDYYFLPSLPALRYLAMLP